jgi:hypothetical protein
MRAVQLNDKIINYFFLSVIFTVLAVHFVFDFKFKTELIQTGNYNQPVYQKPFYGYLVVNGSTHQTGAKPLTSGDRQLDNDLKDLGIIPSESSRTNKALGGDFSQVYAAAYAIRYGYPQYTAQFGVKSAYPPLTNWLYVPLTFLDYNVALIVHSFLSLALFLILALIVLKKYKLHAYSFKFLAFFSLLYFYTPLGFAHFERGQFDFWPASAYLLIFTCIFMERNALAAALAAGLLGALKWSSAPFIGTISLFGWCNSTLKKKWLFVLPPAVMLLSALILYRQVLEYWPILRMYAFQDKPKGVGFMLFLPRSLAEMVQIFSCLLVIIISVSLYRRRERRSDLLQYISFPFALTMFIQGTCFGATSFEYRIVAIIGLVPGFLIWLNYVPDIPEKLKVATAVFFAAFIIITFRVFHYFIWDLPNLASPGMSEFYFLSSLIALVFTCYLIYVKSKMMQAN